MGNEPSQGRVRSPSQHNLNRWHLSRAESTVLKVVLRGARGTGKSQLIRNLGGETSLPDPDAQENPWLGTRQYQPSLESESSRIRATYKTSDEIVDVHLSAVVDSDKTTKDIYEGAALVVIMLDLRRKETLDYARREASCIPLHVQDILFLANFRDCIGLQGAADTKCAPGSSVVGQRQITQEDLSALVKETLAGVAGSTQSRTVHAVESSLKNGFGLRMLRSCLNIPFLRKKHAEILEHLSLAREEVRTLTSLFVPFVFSLQFI